MSDDTREPQEPTPLSEDDMLRGAWRYRGEATSERGAFDDYNRDWMMWARAEITALRSERDDLAAALAVANENATIARGERDALRIVLREIEWAAEREEADITFPACPDCGGLTDNLFNGPRATLHERSLAHLIGHAENCTLAAALTAHNDNTEDDDER